MIMGTDDNESVALEDMLRARDRRRTLQEELLQKYKFNLVSYTLNIAGPCKRYRLADRCFHEGRRMIERQFARNRLNPIRHIFTDEKTGLEMIWVVDADPIRLKTILTAIEEYHPLGRVFDIDIITENGVKISRNEVGLGQRGCLLCGKSGGGCARNRTHSHKEVISAINRIIDGYFNDKYVDLIAGNAVRALLYEVSVTPKPGLVDRANNGAHTDMDFFSFVNSSSVLSAYFRDMASAGIRSRNILPERVLARLRFRGMCAEDEMLAATGGVNTHKGLIFSLGIICAAYGWHGDSYPTADEVLDTAAKIAAPAFHADLQDITLTNFATNGEAVFAKHGLAGIRREAAEGFPAVRKLGLPALREAICIGRSFNDAGVEVLLRFIADVTDTNIISRSSLEKLDDIQSHLTDFLAEGKDTEIIKHAEYLDRQFTHDNISPGGCADLLAVTFMSYFMDEER